MAHTLIENKTYNERLFSPGFRGYLHNARFVWLNRCCRKLNIKKGSVIELGCNDGRSIEYLPFQPDVYSGYDADWEGGHEDALKKWSKFPNYHFYISQLPATFNAHASYYDYSISMETLEHLPEKELDEYLKRLANATRLYGFFSFPNERGIVFLLKYFSKKFFIQQREPYTPSEVWHAFTGRLDKVERNQTGHKGFDYKKLITRLEMYFHIVKVQSIPFSFLPLSLSFTIGVIVKSKKEL